MKRREREAIVDGALLGSANALFISIAMCWYIHVNAAMAVPVFVVGMAPGVFGGMLLGAISGLTSRRGIWLRRALIGVPAIAIVVALGLVFDLGTLIVPATIPTIVCTLILERRTRYLAPVPLAVVR